MRFELKFKIIITLVTFFLFFNITFIKNSFSEVLPSSILSSKKDNPKRITIMTYNLENLFDTQDDPEKNDESYLPLSVKAKSPLIQKKCQSLQPQWRSECKNLDWSEKKLKSKMHRLSDVILKSHKGVGPDIIIFQEVENISVLEKLRTEHLKKHYPFKAILIEGPDRRGIDVGILSKLESKEAPNLHLLKFYETSNFKKNQFPVTRGILESSFLLPDQTPIYVFGVHFPSQGTVTEARHQALDQLVKLLKTKKEGLVIAGGDFNITAYEGKKNKYFEKLNPDFLVSHLVGCQSCPGTNYFHPRKSWSFLDVLLFSKNFDPSIDSKKTTLQNRDQKSDLNISSNWQLDTASIRVYNQNLYQNNKWGSPMKFELGRQQQGVSDHWPLLADIFLNSSRSNGTRK